MKSLKVKLMVSIAIIIITLLAISVSVYATNEKVEIIKKSDDEFLIYIEGKDKSDFKFAFSDDVNEIESNLSFIIAGEDSIDANANKIAYIKDTMLQLSIFDDLKTYMWIEEAGVCTVKAVEINLSKALNIKDLEKATTTTKRINVNTTGKKTTNKVVDGKQITTTVGQIAILDNGEFEYQLVKVGNSVKLTGLMDLANKVSKLTGNESMTTKISLYREFITLYNDVEPNTTSGKWKPVKDNLISQAKDAEDGEQYIVWIKTGNIIDAQFMTSTKEYSEETITEYITTKLPATGDDYTLFIILGTLVVAAIAVTVIIVRLKNKEVK